MSSASDDRELGMGRPIPRRDFLNGIALGIAGAYAAALGAGMPIAAVTGRADIVDAAQLGGIGGTYGGSPVACAAAIEAVKMIRQPEFLAQARHHRAAFLPTADVASVPMFETKLIVGVAGPTALGWFLFRRARAASVKV